MNTRLLATLAAAASAITALAGCAAGNPLAASTSRSGDTIVIGSANYPENVLLGETYAQALESAGFKVQRHLNIGAREVLYSQVSDCSIDVVPEYNQALLAFVSPQTTASGTQEVDKALSQKLPSALAILDSAPAEDNNAIAVKTQTAQEKNLKSIADLAPLASGMTFGGPTEWEARAGAYPALEQAYGVKFKEYKVLDYSGPITLSALSKGDVQAALLFSTTPQIKTDGYTILDDPKKVLGVNNVTPLVCQKDVPQKARDVLNSVSAALTTPDLTAMNASYTIEKKNASDVAKAWLSGKGLK